MKNNLFFGILIGLMAPALVHALVVFTSIEERFLPEKPMALYTLAVLINLIVLRFVYRAGKEDTAKGVVVSTFLAMLLYLFTHKITI